MKKKLTIFSLLSIIFISCERDFDIDLLPAEEMIVVEGYIENGRPPYVILTRSANYFDEFNFEKLQELFIRDAVVTVSDGVDTWTLQEMSFDSGGVNFHVYINPFVQGETGKTYHLRVEAENKVITAITTIPWPVPLDSLWLEPHPDTANDSLFRLMAQLTDPAYEVNYYRYFTSRNGGEFLTSPGSLLDDRYIQGQSFPYPIDRGIARGEQVDWTNYYFFEKGDTVNLKWASLDKAHFYFWLSTDYQGSSVGNPFSNVIRINSNISGGLGIWGGYGAEYYSVIVE